MNVKYNNNALKIKIAFAIVLILTLGQVVYSLKNTVSGQKPAVTANQDALINTSNNIVDQLEILNATLSLCEVGRSPCNKAQISVLTQQIAKDVQSFISIASTEKKLISLAGLLKFDYVNLYVKKYNDHKDINTLKLDIEGSLAEVSDISANLNQKLAADIKQNSQSQMAIFFAINTAIFGFFVFGWYLIRKQIRYTVKEKSRLSQSFHHILGDVKTLNHSSLKHRLSDIDSSSDEKKIYSMLLFSFEKLEQQMSKTDLYQRLYNLLGYEIRGITNTIHGGIDLLVNKENVQEVLQAKEITTATRTLENLAENFNLLSTVESSSSTKLVDFYNLISELVVLLSTKSKQQNKLIECYVANTIPLSFYGHHTGLFWLLLMQISETISSSNCRNVLFSLSCSSATRVEKLQINIDLYLYDQDIPSMEHIENLAWGVVPKKDITNKALVKTLLNQIKKYHVIQKNIDDISRVRISFDVTPVDYQTENNQLYGRTLLICGASYMQVDVIEQMLTDQGAKVIIARTGNELFQSIKELSPQDGIILTNTIQGVNLQSFCKILKARLNKKVIKIFLSLSSSNIDEKLYEHVDHVFYHPCPPSDFIAHIVEHINKDEDAAVDEKSEKILIVEDDRLQQFILKKILTDLGFDCDTANDGKEAIESVKVGDYKTVFMDCIMPNLDGLEATSRIRQSDNENNLPDRVIIGATALTSNDEHQKCISAGMDYVIHKPYKKDEIFNVLRKYLAINKANK
ncbi:MULTISPECIES: response regulator [unclassified Shewanella]|uniref:response regulator n=1 Tax=unclassified Shewanella TaxID=196818 RepID=UPI000C82E1CA|nr:MULTISPECIES: response regulator [unclassified Shewanella]MDO6617984.1 response regulator [Shewanella sp. 6_MG-2023]PMH97820.1 hypothetical protein BCU55_17635 [Shewanella sp. 10N.286.48.A6]